MTEAQPDTVITDSPQPTALADNSPDFDTDEGPWTVHGVALPENEPATGVAGKTVYYPPDVLEAAADALAGRHIVDDRDHNEDSFDRIHPAIENIIGEVTDTKYEPGIGVLYEGEVDDRETAKQIDRGRVDPSPMLFRHLGDFDDEKDAYPATEIAHWRDLAVVGTGASDSASIQPGAATALQAEALRATFESAEPDALRQFTHLQYNCQQETGKLDESEIPNDAYRSHYLFPASTKSASSYPVVGGDNCLYKQNVISAWRLRGRAPGDTASIERILLNLASKFDEMPFSKEDADALAQHPDDGGRNPPTDPDADNGDSHTMDLTEDEEALIHTARSTDNPAVVAAETKSLAERAAEQNFDQYDDPKVVGSTDYDALQERVSVVKGVFADALAQRTDMKPETADALSLDALVGEFENDDGELEADALAQNPETGGAGNPDEDDPQPDALSAAEQEKADLLSKRVERMEAQGWDSAAQTNRQKLADLTGDESVLDGGNN